MASSDEQKFNLKLLIDKKSQKVLFAEVGKDVVDFLFSLLSLPLGSVIKLITEESVLGSLRNTYSSWNKLDDNVLVSAQMKATLLSTDIIPSAPSSKSVLLFSHENLGTEKEVVYKCSNCNTKSYFTNSRVCPTCRYNHTASSLTYVGDSVTKEKVEKNGYVKDRFTYAVMDDLGVVPMMPLESMALVDKMGYKDFSKLEQKAVDLDLNKGWELLKTSLCSKNVLTDVFLAKKKEGHGKEVK